MGLKVYFDLMSQPSRALILFLRLTKIPFESKAVALRKGEHHTDDFEKINPFRLVPVIDDDGFKLTESVAILSYLCDKYNVADHWFPRDLKKRARVMEYMNWQHFNTRVYGAMVFRIQVIEPRATGEPIDQNKLARFQASLETSLDHMENVWLKDRPYLCGHAISVADLLGVCELMQPTMCGQDVTKNRPILKAWMDRVKEDTKAHFDDAHKIVYRTQKILAHKFPSKL